MLPTLTLRIPGARFFLLAAALSLVACSGGGGGSAGDKNKGDTDALEACGTATCPKGSVQQVEGESLVVQDMTCIVQAAHDRKPGLYHIALEATTTGSEDDSDYTFVIGPSGDAQVGVHHLQAVMEDVTESWDPVKRCALAPVSFFESCLTDTKAAEAAGQNASSLSCVYPDLPWFDSCEEKAPACE